MGLTKSQQALVTKARNAGSSELGVSLDDETCMYLIARIVHDLNLLSRFPQVTKNVPEFFSPSTLNTLRLEQGDFLEVLEFLLSEVSDADTYFYCLAVLHKARLKYERILQAQALPTIDQVGPRGLLQFGSLSSRALVGLLFWRKWLFDIDNRAGQETGYVFEPIIAYSIGGLPFSAKKSPVKRGGIGPNGRQVDCVRDDKAYEIKLRVTIAASGQGRWGEELEFPKDCRASNFTPVLIVLDPTPNPKLTELKNSFLAENGEVYIGQAAWDHLASVAGPTMARFLDLYVHHPINSLLAASPEKLPRMSLELNDDALKIIVADEILLINRDRFNQISSENDEIPIDIDEDNPGL